jgi:endoglucanase
VLFGEWAADKKPAEPDLTGALIDLNYASVTYWNKFVHDAINSRGMFSTCWDINGRIFDWTTGAVQDQNMLNAVLGKSALPRPPGTL